MTREEVKKAAEIMLAFADGAEIQYSHKGKDNWINWINEFSPSFDWQTFDYRIKPESKYRPFKTQEECWNEMHKHPDLGYIKNIVRDEIVQIMRIGDEELNVLDYTISPYAFGLSFQTFVFTDGEPFGIKEG